MANIYQQSKLFRKALISRESASTMAIIRRYQQVEKSLLQQLAKAEKDLASVVGKEITDAFWRRERIAKLLEDTQRQIQRFGEFSAEVTTTGQGALVDMAVRHAELMGQGGINRSPLVTGTWNRVPVESLEHLVGNLQDGSPLAVLFDGMGKEASEKLKDVLVEAVADGTGPRGTARAMKESLGGNLSRSLTIARTEQLRSYRQATLDNYQANDDVVEGWIRVETLDDLTCPICIAEHGTEYELEVEFETHPNCRGTLVPKIKGDTQADKIQTGEEWFAQQDEEKQKEILGEARWKHYDGGMGLKQMVGRTEHPDWGGGRRLLSLDELANAPIEINLPEPDPTPAPPEWEPRSTMADQVTDYSGSISRADSNRIVQAHDMYNIIDLPDNTFQRIHVTVRDNIPDAYGFFRHSGDSHYPDLHMRKTGQGGNFIQTYVHELGHAMDRYLKLANNGYGAGMYTERRTAATRAFLSEVQNTGAFRAWKKADDYALSRGRSGVYWTQDVEVFARFTEQYIATENGVYYVGNGGTKPRILGKKHGSDHFSPGEYARLKPLYEGILREAGAKLKGDIL